MVNSFCKAEDYQRILNKRENVNVIRFSKEAIMLPVVDGEGENAHETGEYVDSGLVKFTEDVITGELTADKVVAARIKEVDKYDVSDEINIFSVNGKNMRFNKINSAYIVNKIRTEKANGATTTKLYDYNNKAYELPIDAVIEIFDKLELYAKMCSDVTAAHKTALLLIDNVEDALDYDIKVGYPEKLSFDV